MRLQPCNPSVGGPAKSQLVCEVDAMGGEMGKMADRCYLHKRVLNASKVAGFMHEPPVESFGTSCIHVVSCSAHWVSQHPEVGSYDLRTQHTGITCHSHVATHISQHAQISKATQAICCFKQLMQDTGGVNLTYVSAVDALHSNVGHLPHILVIPGPGCTCSQSPNRQDRVCPGDAAHLGGNTQSIFAGGDGSGVGPRTQ